MFENEDEFAELIGSLEINADPRPGFSEELRQRVLAKFAVVGDAQGSGEMQRGSIARAIRSVGIDAAPELEHREKLQQRMLEVLARKDAGRRFRRQTTVPAGGRSVAWKGRGLRAGALAASIVIGIGLAAWLLSSHILLGTPSFAAVLIQVRRPRTVTYDLTFGRRGQEQPPIRVMVNRAGRIRWELPFGRVHVRDFKIRKAMILGAIERQGKFVRLTPGELREDYDPVENLRKCGEPAGTFVESRKLDARSVNVFSARRPGATMTVWADPDTSLPVRIQIFSARTPFAPKRGAPRRATVTTLSNFAWDASVPESLFSLSLPPGYVEEREYHGPPTEADLLALLRVSAEIVGGAFPARLSEETVTRVVRKLTEENASGLVAPSLRPDEELRGPVVSEAERVLLASAERGFRFVRQQIEGGNSWFYCGRGVTLGAGESPVCWWRPQGSVTYRVVYGDLVVRDVAADELPRAAAESSGDGRP